jgi:NAD+ diphosphatase
MLIFKDDNLLVQGETFDFDVLPPFHILRNSLDLPSAWQTVTPWCEVDSERDAHGAEWINLRFVWQRWGEEAYARAGTAYQYMNWLRHSRFCSDCGGRMSPNKEDKGLRCADCGRVIYAPLHPAIIVAVERDGKLLLAHNTRMPDKRYSILAGFVEPGESLEQTIEREVMEEVGIEVQDIRYFGSQSWPFPCSLMLGFTARWKRGELHPDGVELNDAAWFAPGEYPDIPPSLSISRKLIDDFARRMSC